MPERSGNDEGPDAGLREALSIGRLAQVRRDSFQQLRRGQRWPGQFWRFAHRVGLNRQGRRRSETFLDFSVCQPI